MLIKTSTIVPISYFMRKFIFIFLVLLTACINPPVGGNPDQVIDDKELSILSYVRRGKEYARAGRMDVAEVEFRKAVRIAPDYDVSYNDLGFVLQAQKRNSEAIAAYKKALELKPSSLIYKNNYARALYASSQHELAVKNFIEVAADYEAREKPPKEFSLVELYRNIATTYYALGNISDALCYSNLARTIYPTQEVTAQHMRLLLSQNLTKPVVDVIKGALTVHGENLHSNLLLDYAIALYVEGNRDLSKQAFLKLISRPDTDFSDKQLARLLTSSISSDSEGELLRESIFEDDKDFCSTYLVDQENYWPYTLVEKVELTINEMCA